MKVARFVRAIAAAVAFTGLSAGAATFMVSNTNDSGPGSLRQALTDASACDNTGAQIAFAIGVPGTGPHTIQPQSQLPAVNCMFPTTIDGYTQFDASANTDTGGSSNANIQVILNGGSCSGCNGLVLQSTASVTVRGLAIHSFPGAGIRVDSGYSQVNGNFIGTDPGGMNAFGNNGAGVYVAGGTLYIGNTGGDRNVISSNGVAGIHIVGGGAIIQGNLIGGKRDGSPGNGNGGPGIKVEAGGSGNAYDNYIRYNSGAGAVVLGGTNFTVAGGAIHANGGIGVDLDGDGPTGNDANDLDGGTNSLLNYPTILSYSSCALACDGNPVVAEIYTEPNELVTFHFYSNSTYDSSKREGETYVGSASGVTDAGGYLQLVSFLPAFATNISALTVLDQCMEGCTYSSEFSPMFVPPQAPQVTTAFEPTAIATGGTSNFVVAVKNINTTNINNVGYSVTAPAGLTTVSWVPRADCPPIIPPAAAPKARTSGAVPSQRLFFVGPDGSTIYVAGMDLGPGQTCTIDFGMSAASAGTYTYPANSITVYSDDTPNTTNPASATLVVADPAPAVLLTPTSHTFPTQTVGTTSAPKLVTLKNSGTAPLVISNITTTGDFGYAGCGFPTTLSPGATCTFSITFSPQVTGPHTGSIAIYTNAAGSPHSIGLTGDATSATFPSISTSPSSVQFGAITTGTEATPQRVRLTNTGSAALQIIGIDTTGVSFGQGNACPASIAPGDGCDIVVTFAPSSDGTHTGELRIASNAAGSPHIVPLSGQAMPVPPASLAVPGSLDFGQVVVGTTADRSLELRNTGSQPLVIQDVRATAPFSVVATCGTILPGNVCTLTLRFTPSAFALFGGRLEIVSNSAGGMAVVELFGEGVRVPQPALEVSVDGLGFGNQGIGTQSDPKTVTLHSVGSMPVELRDFLVATPDFIVDASRCPSVLGVDARCDLSVTFRPLAPGPRIGRLTILSSMPGEPAAVSLTGTGCRFFSMGAGRNPGRLCSP